MIERAGQIAAFVALSSWAGSTRHHVAGDASNRRYERLRRSDGNTAILMDAPPEHGETVTPFIDIADHLRRCGLSAPEIYERDIAKGILILEDFGDAEFADLMAKDASQQTPLYQAAIDVLIHLQTRPTPKLPLCTADWLMDMTMPLFDWYAPDTKTKDKDTYKALFQPHLDRVADAETVLILRDFHAQNLMLLPDRSDIKQVGLLDFQDAMLGHPAYDPVSILQDARRDVPPEIESASLSYMLDRVELDNASFRAAYAVLGLQRNLRILGLFARLCLRDGKPLYLDFIPRVWRYIQRNLIHPDLESMAEHLNAVLPPPTPALLEHLKSQCPPHPSPL